MTILSVCYHIAGRRVLLTVRGPETLLLLRQTRFETVLQAVVQNPTVGCIHEDRMYFVSAFADHVFFSRPASARAVSVRACFISTRIICAMSPSSVGRDCYQPASICHAIRCILYCTFTRRRTYVYCRHDNNVAALGSFPAYGRARVLTRPAAAG